MAAVAACALAVLPERAEAQICPWPADVANDLITTIQTCFNCLVEVPPACPALQRQRCFEFPEDPSEAVCDKIASAEVKGCSKAVRDAASCNDARNTANATAENANCLTLPDAGAQRACSDGVAADLSALEQSVKEAAAAGQQACLDRQADVRSLCLGDPT